MKVSNICVTFSSSSSSTSFRLCLPKLIAICVLLCCSSYLDAHHVRNRMSIYYESICPDSRRFMLQQVIPLFDKFDQFVDLELIAFGNANVSYPNFDNKPYFQCQHGPDECYGNKAHSCVIELTRNTRSTLQYIKCMFEPDDWKMTRTVAMRCANRLSIEWDRLRDCIDGTQGDRIMIANSHKTFNLIPGHKSVPWIVIDGKHDDVMQSRGEDNLLKYLCETFHDHEPRLSQCSQESLSQLKFTNIASQSLSQSSIMIAISMTIIIAGLIPL